MKRIFLLISAVICIYIGILAGKYLPADTHDLVEEKYASWAGVIRIHAYPDAITWLNEAAVTFENEHPGVYLHIRSLPTSALAAPGIAEPDMLVAPPGAFDGGHIIGNHVCHIRTDDPQRRPLCLEFIALLSAQ